MKFIEAANTTFTGYNESYCYQQTKETKAVKIKVLYFYSNNTPCTISDGSLRKMIRLSSLEYLTAYHQHKQSVDSCFEPRNCKSILSIVAAFLPLTTTRYHQTSCYYRSNETKTKRQNWLKTGCTYRLGTIRRWWKNRKSCDVELLHRPAAADYTVDYRCNWVHKYSRSTPT